ncbi:unnamed protein product [Spirodela intermedia]|uniref:Uncharacterized protein n=1 Tax=Spirodela intermedia TaxID=51605 RepID=A0A7I8JGH0_SPIIN|nr:unnamed protein product [Spirodela intermedia]CAA6668623.1 unnamed protein product [Spirodela intermedia]
MATTGKHAAAPALLVLLAVALIAPASASTLTVFSGPGCSGQSKDINGCGCFDLTGYQSGFHFVFTEEQEVVLHTDRHCNNGYRSHKDVNGCGCFDLTGYQSGFHFVFTEEQEAVLYTDRHCRNSYRTKFLDEETRYCRRFPFRSVEMVC